MADRSAATNMPSSDRNTLAPRSTQPHHMIGYHLVPPGTQTQRSKVWLGDRRRRSVRPPAFQSPLQRVVRRFARAAVTVATALTFFCLHERCAVKRSPIAVKSVHDGFLPRAKLAPTLVDQAEQGDSGSAAQQQATNEVCANAEPDFGKAWRMVTNNFDWGLLGAGATVCAMI